MEQFNLNYRLQRKASEQHSRKVFTLLYGDQDAPEPSVDTWHSGSSANKWTAQDMSVKLRLHVRLE